MAVYDAENLYLNRAKFVMTFLGVWLPSDHEHMGLKVYRAFMLSLQYQFLMFQIVYVIQVWGDLEAVSQASYLLFTQACLCFKVTVFLLNRDLGNSLIGQMRANVFQPVSARHEEIHKWHAARIKRLLLAFMVSSQVTCGLWALKPLFDDNGSGSREFPFRMWMPISTEQSPHYEIGFACQLLAISMSAYMYFGVDSVTMSMIIFGCAQMDVIKDKLMRIQSVNRNDSRNYNIDQETKALKENYETFISCVVHYQAVIRFTKDLESTYHTYLAFQLSGSVGLICMSALRILVVSWQSMQFFSILTYLSVMIMQMYICCWCGHELTATSESLAGSLLLYPWYQQSIRFRKALLFTMMRMRRPLVFRAGLYIPLSRQTFVSILRMSYSYFAVLQQTHKE